MKGIYSHDPILHQNTDELWRFLVSDLRRPRMSVYVTGEHTKHETKRGAHSKTEHTSRTVTDFSRRMDVSHYVIPQWSIIGALPASLKDNEKGMPVPTLRETLEEYTSSENMFKEFRLKKLSLWDFERLRQLITDLVRSSGYRDTVRVQFPMEAYKMVALASNPALRAAHSKIVRVICRVSCLVLLFWPAWATARKSMNNRLVCEYPMAVDVDEFSSRNCAKIQSIVVYRHRGEKLVALLINVVETEENVQASECTTANLPLVFFIAMNSVTSNRMLFSGSKIVFNCRFINGLLRSSKLENNIFADVETSRILRILC